MSCCCARASADPLPPRPVVQTASWIAVDPLLFGRWGSAPSRSNASTAVEAPVTHGTMQWRDSTERGGVRIRTDRNEVFDHSSLSRRFPTYWTQGHRWLRRAAVRLRAGSERGRWRRTPLVVGRTQRRRRMRQHGVRCPHRTPGRDRSRKRTHRPDRSATDSAAALPARQQLRTATAPRSPEPTASTNATRSRPVATPPSVSRALVGRTCGRRRLRCQRPFDGRRC